MTGRRYGQDIPLLVNLQPAGEYLGEDYYRAGGVPAVVAELMRQGLIDEAALTVNGRTLGENCRDASILDTDVIRPFEQPLKQQAGFTVLRGNLFDSAIMKTSVISDEFRARYLSNPTIRRRSKDAPSCSTGRRTITRASTIRRSASMSDTLLFMRGTGPIGYPGAAEVVNMRPPADAHQSGHSSPAVHRRRPAVGHLRLAVDSQCLAGSSGRRRTCAAANRRSRAHRFAARRGEHSRQRRRAERAASRA